MIDLKKKLPSQLIAMQHFRMGLKEIVGFVENNVGDLRQQEVERQRILDDDDEEFGERGEMVKLCSDTLQEVKTMLGLVP